MILDDPITRAETQWLIREYAQNRKERFYPATGPLRRQLYVKHLSFFRAGQDHTERACIAANRVGKTEGISAYEVTCHLTGEYPDWWEGRRFLAPISAWACGATNMQTRDILQAKLLGKITRGRDDAPGAMIGLGTGMIPARAIIETRTKAGIPDAIETTYIKHASGGRAVLTFKSYEQGRKAFEGTETDVIALDEEPPEDIYVECCLRTMRTAAFGGGTIICTFTPLAGWSGVVELYLGDHERNAGNRFAVQIGWDDAPHLSAEEKASMLAKIPAYQRQARSLGVPQLGSGAIYPVDPASFTIDPIQIPSHWPRAYGMDCGTKTAVMFGALDRDTDTLYLYSEYYREDVEPALHVAAVRSRGGKSSDGQGWIPGVIDPVGYGFRLGLDVWEANNAVEAGIAEVWMRMASGRLKVFSTCTRFFDELRLYRRDEKGKVVKARDHMMDAMRYLVMSGLQRAVPEIPVAAPSGDYHDDGWSSNPHRRIPQEVSWMA